MKCGLRHVTKRERRSWLGSEQQGSLHRHRNAQLQSRREFRWEKAWHPRREVNGRCEEPGDQWGCSLWAPWGDKTARQRLCPASPGRGETTLGSGTENQETQFQPKAQTKDFQFPFHAQFYQVLLWSFEKQNRKLGDLLHCNLPSPFQVKG